MQQFIQDLLNDLQTMHPALSLFFSICLVCLLLVILRMIQGVVEKLHLVFAGMLVALIIFGGGYVIFFTNAFRAPQVVPTQVSQPESTTQPTA